VGLRPGDKPACRHLKRPVSLAITLARFPCVRRETCWCAARTVAFAPTWNDSPNGGARPCIIILTAGSRTALRPVAEHSLVCHDDGRGTPDLKSRAHRVQNGTPTTTFLGLVALLHRPSSNDATPPGESNCLRGAAYKFQRCGNQSGVEYHRPLDRVAPLQRPAPIAKTGSRTRHPFGIEGPFAAARFLATRCPRAITLCRHPAGLNNLLASRPAQRRLGQPPNVPTQPPCSWRLFFPRCPRGFFSPSRGPWQTPQKTAVLSTPQRTHWLGTFPPPNEVEC